MQMHANANITHIANFWPGFRGPWSALAQAWQALAVDWTASYRPEKHYMRGPGPKWHAKHAQQ